MASFAEWTEQNKKKKKKAEGATFTEYTKQVLERDDIEAPLSEREDIAPVKSERKTTESEVAKSILRDANWYEATVKSAQRGYYNSRYGEETFADIMGKENESDKYRKILEDEEYQFEADGWLKKAVSGGSELLGQMARQLTNEDTLQAGLAGAGTFATGAAIMGQAGPQIAAPEEIVTVPGAALLGLKTGLTVGSAKANLEIEAGHAYNEMLENDISEETAKNIALAVGVVNAGLEFVQADELLKAYKVLNKSGVAGNVMKKLGQELLDRGVDVAKETAQEVAQEGVTIAGVQAASKKETGEWAYNKEDVASRLGETAISSALSFGALNVPSGSVNVANIVSESKLTENEQKVVDKVYEDRVAEAEKNGTVSQKEKSKIYNEVLEEMEKGYISTDTIEEVLGGDTYKNYQNTVKNEDSLRETFNELNKMKQGEMTGEQIDLRNELKEQLKELESKGERNQLKSRLDSEVMSLVKGDRLMESYNERSRRGQAFEADLTKYDEKQQEVIKRAAESGILNNTRRTHEFVDMVAKISADKGVLFDFTDNQRLKESGFAVDGKQVNGYVQDGKITLNMQSAKALDTVVGHEITHVLEGTELYDALKQSVFEYAKSKNVYDSRLADLTETYKNVKDADIEAELTADLVGDFLFTDTDFVNSLTANKNVFQKIYDEIKYLCKVATAGSEEARNLEKVKRAFEKAYKEGGKGDSKVRYSLKGEKANLSAEDKTNLQTAKKMKDSGKSNEEIYRETGWYTQSDGKWRAEIPDEIMIPQNFSRTGLQSAKDSEAERYIAKAEKSLKDGSISEETYNELVEFAEGVRNKDYDSGKLPVFLDAPKLYEAYPQLRNVSLFFKKLSGMQGYTDSGLNQIVLDPDGLHDVGQTVREGLAHEIQHIIQNIEGFARGSNPKDAGSYEAYRKAGGEIEARDVEERLRMTPEERRNNMPVQFSISEYTDAEKKAHNKAVVDHFGKTYKWAETGYVLLDGTKLDLSGKHEGAPGGYRSVDHRDIVDALGDDYGDGSYSGSLVQFMSEGNIRISPESNGINLSVKPTKAQEQALSDFISRARGEVLLDIDGLDGYTVVSVEYPRGTHANKVLNDIREWFDNGKEPQVSNLSQFRYSLSDSSGKQLTEAQQEYFKDSKVRDENGNLKVMWRGGNSDFTVFDRKKSKYTNLYGRGFYFTDSESHAKQYGNARAFYLDIKNPVSNTEQTITKDQMRKFLDAVVENEDDYSFENYGYGATVDSVLDSVYSGKSDFAMLYDVSQTAIGDMVETVELFNEVNGTDYDGLILDTETVAFRSNQIKNTDNLKPTADEDIRYSLSNEGEVAPVGNFYGKDMVLESAPVEETVSKTESVEESAPVAVAENAPTTMFPDDLAPVTEDNTERFDSLSDADAPPEMDAPVTEEVPFENGQAVEVEDPFENREVPHGNEGRKQKAYMYENPEVKPFFQAEAIALLEELNNGTKGEKWYNDHLYYETGGEQGFGGTKRHQSESIDRLSYEFDLSYAEIEKGLNAIIEDHGAENIAAAKKIEFVINDRLMYGYKPFGMMLPPDAGMPNQDYIALMQDKQRVDSLTDADAPPISEDIAEEPMVETNIGKMPLAEYRDMMAQQNGFDDYADMRSQRVKLGNSYDTSDIAPVAMKRDSNPAVTEKYEAIRPKPKKEPKLARATPEEQARANILTEEPKTEKKKSSLWSMVKNNVLDKGMVFEDLSLKTGNRELQARWNTIRYADGKAQRFMEKNLKPIIDKVNASGKTQQFYEYLYHMHNADRMTLAQRYEDTPNKPVFGDGVTADVSRQESAKLAKANPEFKRWAEEVYNYNRQNRELLVEGGVISRETADLWEQMYPHYVPIRRVGDEGLNINVPLDTGRTGVNAPIKRATGGNRDIMPLFDTLGQRTMQTYKAVAKNRFGVELKNTLGSPVENEALGLDEIIDSIDAHESLLQEGKNGKSPTFTVFEKGEKVTFEITEEMYDAMKPKSKGMAYTSKVLSGANNIRRGLLTEYNPAFMFTNPIKDAQDVLMNSQHPARTYANFPKAIAELMGKKGRWYQEYMDNGGEQNTYFESDTNTFAKEKSTLRKVVGFPLDKISDINNFIERVPRMAEYIASRKMGNSIDVSMLDAARVTTNFAAGGDLTKLLNRNGVTFLNASVQGAIQQVRNVREAKANGLKGAMILTAKLAAAGLPSILLNHLLWDDDEEYEELSDYVKQNYYIVGKFGDGKFVRIPKGRALAVIQNGFEQMENLITGNDEVDLATFGELLVTNLAPNNPLDNNLLAPVGQALSNTTWYGEDLVPTRLQDLPAAEQYDETTDSISRWLGEKTNISPYKINYLLDQYSGGLGDVALPYLTPEAERGKNSVLAPLSDKFTTDSVMKNQNVSDFYDTKDELATNAKMRDATDEDILMSKYMNSVNSELSKLYADKREVQNMNISDEAKYRWVREIQEEIVELTKEGLATYDDVSVYDDYAKVGNRHYRRNKDGEWQKISDDQLEKQEEVTNGLGIEPDEYWANKEEYDYAYEKPEKYALAKAVGGYSAFRGYSSELYDIKADKDSSGKSISGSRKEKVLDYINNLDIDYGERLILFKSEYNADDTYNAEIIEYLNGRDDISYEDTVTILKELGFTVTADGTVYWD